MTIQKKGERVNIRQSSKIQGVKLACNPLKDTIPHLKGKGYAIAGIGDAGRESCKPIFTFARNDAGKNYY